MTSTKKLLLTLCNLVLTFYWLVVWWLFSLGLGLKCVDVGIRGVARADCTLGLWIVKAALLLVVLGPLISIALFVVKKKQNVVVIVNLFYIIIAIAFTIYQQLL